MTYFTAFFCQQLLQFFDSLYVENDVLGSSLVCQSHLSIFSKYFALCIRLFLCYKVCTEIPASNYIDKGYQNKTNRLVLIKLCLCFFLRKNTVTICLFI